MRKFLVGFLVSILSISFMACGAGSSNSKSTYTVEDFYVYDEDGEVYNYPSDETIHFYDDVKGLSYDMNDLGEDNLLYQTKRGVHIHDVAKLAFKDYDLNDFDLEVTKWPILGSLDAAGEAIEADFKEKYPDNNEAIKHSNEIDYSIFLMLECSVDDEGNLTVVEPGESIDRFANDYYELVFYIRDDRVIEWYVRNEPKVELHLIEP